MSRMFTYLTKTECGWEPMMQLELSAHTAREQLILCIKDGMTDGLRLQSDSVTFEISAGELLETVPDDTPVIPF